MSRLVLLRSRSTDQGTLGALVRENGSRLAWALELPWRDNRRQRSCIPAGVYRCQMRWSPKFGRVYEVQLVPGRSAILAHAGNVAGDAALGYRTHSQGCVLLGLQLGLDHGQLAVLLSRPAVSQLVAEQRGEPFHLEVKPWASSTAS